MGKQSFMMIFPEIEKICLILAESNGSSDTLFSAFWYTTDYHCLALKGISVWREETRCFQPKTEPNVLTK